jgi:DNA-binding MarR family transcriptional regulator
LTNDLFQVLKQLPRLRFKQVSIDGLKRSEYELLLVLAMNMDEHKQTFTVTEVSNLLYITPAGVTHLVNSLEGSGHIQRQHDPSDRRIVRIGITEKGSRVAETLLAMSRQQLNGLIDYLGTEDSQTFIRLLSKSIQFFADHLES